MEPTLFRQSGSRAKATDANRNLGCDPWSIQQSRPPYHTGALASARVSIYEGVAYCVMSQILTLWANGKTRKFWFPVIRVNNEKLGHMLKPLVPKFRLDLCARLKDIAEKQIPAKLKPIAGQVKWPYILKALWCHISYSLWSINVKLSGYHKNIIR